MQYLAQINSLLLKVKPLVLRMTNIIDKTVYERRMPDLGMPTERKLSHNAHISKTAFVYLRMFFRYSHIKEAYDQCRVYKC